MTKHLEELEEISRLRLGIILLIKELDKHKEYKGIIDYLIDYEIWKQTLYKEEK